MGGCPCHQGRFGYWQGPNDWRELVTHSNTVRLHGANGYATSADKAIFSASFGIDETADADNHSARSVFHDARSAFCQRRPRSSGSSGRSPGLGIRRSRGERQPLAFRPRSGFMRPGRAWNRAKPTAWRTSGGNVFKSLRLDPIQKSGFGPSVSPVLLSCQFRHSSATLASGAARSAWTSAHGLSSASDEPRRGTSATLASRFSVLWGADRQRAARQSR